MAGGSEPSSDPTHYPHGGTYADLLCWHMNYWGTRPKGSITANGIPWGIEEFKRAAFGNKWDSDSIRVGMSSWRGKGSAPNDLTASLISSELFGDNPIFEDWRNDLKAARDRSSKGKNRRTVEFPKPPPVAAPTDKVPKPTAYFIGRDDEREALAKALVLGNSPAILIQGGLGIGKTELTKAIAHHPDVVARFGERRYFVGLETENTAAKMQGAIIRAVGCDPQYDFPVALVTLRGKQTLLILDNLETSWEPAAEQKATEAALADLAAVSGVAVLASIRGAQFVGGQRWNFQPLGELQASHAIDLFASIAGDKVRGDPSLVNFMNVLGGLPLAIDLVARRARGRASLASLWQEWERVGTDLAKDSHFEPGRLTSLPHSIELSLHQLHSDEGDHPALRLFSYLGVLPDGLTDWDVKRLMGDDGFRAVEKLCHIGLAFERADRINLLPPIRDHTRFHYPPNKDDTRLWTRYFVGKLYGYTAPGEAAATEKQQYLSDSYHNLEAAIMAAKDTRLVDGTVIQNFCEVVQMGFKSADSMVALANHFAESCNFFGEATCYRYMASFYAERGELQKARDLYFGALRLFEDWGGAANRIDCLFGLADIAEAQGDNSTAKEFARAVRPWAILIEDDEWGAGDRARSFAQIARSDGELDLACYYFEQAIQKYQQFNDNRSLAICYRSRGACLAKLGRNDDAKSSFATALSRYSFLHNTGGMARCLKEIGDLHRIEGDDIAAEHCYRDARDLYRNIGDAIAAEGCDRALAD